MNTSVTPLVAGHRYKALWTNFDDHVFVLCKKVCRKLPALSRISNYMSFEKNRILLKRLVESQYCPLTWMFYSRKVNSKINHIHGRYLK